jgi:hypothetical protein
MYYLYLLRLWHLLIFIEAMTSTYIYWGYDIYLYLLRLWHLLICWFFKYWWQFPRLGCGVHSRWKGGGGYIMEIQYIICTSVCTIAATEDYFCIPTPWVYFSSGSQQSLSRLSYYSLIFCRCFVYLFVCFSLFTFLCLLFFVYFWDCFCSRR